MDHPLLAVVFILGLAAIAAGFWLITPAAGLIVGGTLAALIAGVLGAQPGGER